MGHFLLLGSAAAFVACMFEEPGDCFQLGVETVECLSGAAANCVQVHCALCRLCESVLPFLCFEVHSALFFPPLSFVFSNACQESRVLL